MLQTAQTCYKFHKIISLLSLDNQNANSGKKKDWIEINLEIQIVHIVAIDLEGIVLEGSEVLATTSLSLRKIAIFPL